MPEWLAIAAVVYGLGVLAGLVGGDAPPVARVGLALAWPVGPAAFIVTVAGLLVVAMVAFPVFGAGVLLAAAAVLYRLLASA